MRGAGGMCCGLLAAFPAPPMQVVRAQDIAAPPSAETAQRVYRDKTRAATPCPVGDGRDIVVCGAREQSRYRLPLPRDDPPRSRDPTDPAGRLGAIREKGGWGAQPCSVSGGGGFVGCSAKELRHIAGKE